MLDVQSFAQHQPQTRRFNPYTENGGTILAIAGADFSVIAGDTRQSEGYSIQTRYAPKVFPLTDKAVLAVNGFAADGNMFVKKVRQKLEWYRHAHAKDMPIRSIARLIQTMLYSRRFFPYMYTIYLVGLRTTALGRCTHLIPWDRMNARPVAPRVQRNHLFNLFWTIRSTLRIKRQRKGNHFRHIFRCRVF
jgi:20S proteasome subunit beta 6